MIRRSSAGADLDVEPSNATSELFELRKTVHSPEAVCFEVSPRSIIDDTLASTLEFSEIGNNAEIIRIPVLIRRAMRAAQD
jgi:hypothetical protein